MADHVEELDHKKEETLMDKITEKFHSHDEGGSSSSSSDSDSEKKSEKIPKSSSPSSPPSSSTMKAKISRLFGREKPVHKVLGGGKPADVFLWRNKKISAVTLGGATLVWVLFEFLEYHLLTLVCHVLILVLAMSFLWSNATTFINKSPPRIPEVRLAEEPFVQTAVVLRTEINNALAVLREIASGRDLKKFLIVIAGLWFFSVLGSCCNFLTLFYITFVLLHTVPVLYEKYEDKVDHYAEKAMIEIKKQYAVFDKVVVQEALNKMPRYMNLKNKKKA